ncbi:hypothetical protein FANTH_7874 [Fusarium anthophilum]|uniref:Chitin-binding type-1 domain-containing protein n=1 Tax=Fusarium anthophilum TaxID=48485 RepID=A0A8H4ZCU5_9HYPO|nr:hypothetical protein FANTH_7874 [Fusarium anthophilum]
MKLAGLFWLLLAFVAAQSSTVSLSPWQTGKVTPDGTCGEGTGFVCSPTWGACCSKDGICGRSSKYCGEGCQRSAGNCNAAAPPPETPPQVLGVSLLTVLVAAQTSSSVAEVLLGIVVLNKVGAVILLITAATTVSPTLEHAVLLVISHSMVNVAPTARSVETLAMEIAVLAPGGAAIKPITAVLAVKMASAHALLRPTSLPTVSAGSSSACMTKDIPTLDGSCGSEVGLTCSGGPFDGQCCSDGGYCGTSTHCGSGCQRGFGRCN